MNNLIAFDVESGGLNPDKSSLLTAYFVILNDQYNAIDELELLIKPDEDEVYHVTAKALSINKINLVEHHKNAITKGQAAIKLADFLFRNTNMKQAKLTPCAHNINFDLSFIFKHLMPKEVWEQYVDYHTLDTASEAEFLKHKKVLPENLSTSLQSLSKYFNIDYSGAHNSKVDTVILVQVLERLLKL